MVEADEYDTAFFDKRSKFIHYAPRTAILNNLEFDHADIFENLAAIERQFHHLVRTVPGNGLIISPYRDSVLEAVLSQGLWSPRQQFGVNVPDEVCRLLASGGGAFWNANLSGDSGEAFEVVHYGQGATGEVVSRCAVEWALTGEHNVRNALAAIAAARHAGIDTATLLQPCANLKGSNGAWSIWARLEVSRSMMILPITPPRLTQRSEAWRQNGCRRFGRTP